MTKRTLWYMCLGLLCCGALAMVVFAAASPNGQASTPRPVTVKSVPYTGTGNTPPPPSADVLLQQTIKEQKLQEQAIKEQKLQQFAREHELAAPVVSPSRTVVPPLSPEIQAIYQRWQDTGIATPEEKARVEEYFARRNEGAGRNPLDDTGGPDVFGYRFVDNLAGDSAQYNWIELRGDAGATWISGWQSYDDGCATTSYPIGFSFPFYGGSYTTFTPTSNGSIDFGTCYAYAYYSCVPNASDPAAIYPFLYDLHLQRGGIPGGTTVVGYKNFGSYTVIEYDSIGYYSSGYTGSSLKFQVILFDDGRVKLQYNNMVYVGAPAMGTVGVQAAAGTGGNNLQYRCYSSGNTFRPLNNGRAIWFYLGAAEAGRCCYNSGANCADNFPAECAALGGTWTGGMTCAANPCPQLPWNDNCVNVPPLPCPISTTGDNSLATNDCGLTGGYDGETWHAFHLDVPSDVAIRTCGLSGTWQNFWIIITQCPCVSYIFNSSYTFPDATCANGGVIVYYTALPAGDYWVPVMHSFTYGASGPYSIDITCTPVTVGRCCYNLNANCADNTQTQCAALGGNWDVTLNCIANPCPPPPPCTADFIVTAPYTSPERNTCGSLNDCALVTSEEQMYEVTIPTTGEWEFMLCDEAAVFWDTYLRIGTTCCTADIWSQDDGCGGINYYHSRTPCLQLTAGTYWVAVEGLYAGQCGGYILSIQQCAPPPIGRCCYGDPQAPSCIDNTAAECAALAGTWDQTLTCALNPCPICDVTNQGCPLEGEPTCADEYTDMFNGGCNSTPYVFSPILCNQCVFGTSGTFLYAGNLYRDTDWYRLVLDQPNTITWTATAEFPVLIFVINAGTENCADYTILGNITANPCQPATLTFAVNAGVYWLWVGPSVFSGVTCGREYVASLTTLTPCVCEDPTNLTVLRSTLYPDSVRVSWYSSQTTGIYRVFGTTDKNNDQDPDNGGDPAWSLIREVAAPAVPGSQFIRHAPLVPYMNYAVVHDCAPRGRCCYGDPGNPSCQSPVTEAACGALQGSWSAGLNCTDNPCPVLLHHDNCANAEVILSFPYTDVDDNTGATMECAAGGYREVWYTFTTTSTCNLSIAYCGTSPAFGNAYIVLDTSCPCSGAWTFASTWENTSCGDGNWTIYWNNLPAGTYWAPILTDVGSEGPYTVTFACGAPGQGRCCYNGGLNCLNGTLDDCAAVGGTWTENLTCEANPCPVAPANDNCANAIPVLANTPTAFSTVGATTDGVWPCAAGGSDIWYTFTATATGTETVTLCGFGTTYDSAVMVLASCGGANLACNDDFCEGLVSQTTFAATSGVTYLIAIGGFASGTGSGSFSVSP